MKRIKITVMKQTVYKDLSLAYEIPQENACNVKVGQVFYTDGKTCPRGLCESAWDTIKPFAIRLINGEEKIFGNWMKNPKSVMLSCNDGFRPTTFYIELDEKNEAD